MKESERNKSHTEGVSGRESERERLFELVERRVALIRELWEGMQNLSIPNVEDSKSVVDNEEKVFQKFFQRAEKEFSSEASQIKEYEDREHLIYEIHEEFYRMGAGKESTKAYQDMIRKLDQLMEKQSELLENEDFRFFLSYYKGINGAQKKREEVRRVLKEVGKRGNINEEIISYLPKSFQAPLRGKVEKVIVERFSISVVLNGEAYKKVAKNPRSMGFHQPGGIWNFLSGDITGYAIEEILRDIVKHGGRISGKRIKELAVGIRENAHGVTSAHEDFHSFFNGFSESGNAFSFATLNDIVDRIIGVKERKAHAIFIKIHLQDLRKSIRLFQDFGHEELLAEIASEPWDRIPSSTFATRMADAEEKIRLLKGKDPDIDRIIDENLSYLDFSHFRERFQGAYKILQEKAPERLNDFGVACAMFPPSQFRHIERLVERWAEQSEKTVE